MNFRRVIKAGLATVVPQSVYLSINARVAAKDIASKRRWAPEIDFLPKFVRDGDTVVDVGGNHGLYTYHLSRLVGPAGRVHTFEPLPPNLRILRHTIKVHNLENVTVHPEACGEGSKRTTFCVRLEHGVPELGGGRQGEEGLRFACDIVRLDDVIRPRITFLKIDVEGAELLVLRGAERILRESHPVILFEAGGLTPHYGYSQQDVFDFLSHFRYKFFNGKMQPRSSFTETIDYFCIPE
jgi:FkbM family methyltransferase